MNSRESKLALTFPDHVSEDKLRELFASECSRRKIDPDRARRLMTHWKYRMNSRNLKSEMDILVAEILCDMRIAHGVKAINKSFENDIKTLKKKWQ